MTQMNTDNAERNTERELATDFTDYTDNTERNTEYLLRRKRLVLRSEGYFAE